MKARELWLLAWRQSDPTALPAVQGNFVHRFDFVLVSSRRSTCTRARCLMEAWDLQSLWIAG